MNDRTEGSSGGMRLWMALARTVAVLSQKVDDALQEEVGISATDKTVLTHLAMAQGPLWMVDLARALLLTKAGVTRMVDRLEEMGLVVRLPSERDRRVTRIAITDAGRAHWKRANVVLRRRLAEGLSDHLSAEEAHTVQELLERVLLANGVATGERRRVIRWRRIRVRDPYLTAGAAWGLAPIIHVRPRRMRDDVRYRPAAALPDAEGRP